MLWSKKPVYDYFVIHLHFIKTFLFMINLSTHISNRCSVKTENLDVASTLWRQYHVTYWTNENRAIGQQLTGQLNSFATNMDFFVNSQNVVYLLYWSYTVEKLIVYICFSWWLTGVSYMGYPIWSDQILWSAQVHRYLVRSDFNQIDGSSLITVVLHVVRKDGSYMKQVSV